MSSPSPGDYHIRLKHFTTHFFNAENQEVPSDTPVFSVEFPQYQDVIDLVPYVQDGQGLRMALVRSFRPIVAERTKQGVGERLRAPEDTERMWEVFGGYIRQEEGEAGMDRSVVRILERKFPNARIQGTLEILGGCYFPSVGTATELVYPRAVQIEVDGELPDDIALRTPQEIVDGYLSGRYFSMRLVELAFRFARAKRIPLFYNGAPLQQLPVTLDSIADKRVTLSEARSLVSTLDARGATIVHVDVAEVAPPEKMFLNSISSPVTLPNGTEETFEFVVRKGIDSVDVGCYVSTDEGIFMPIKVGVRPTLAVRNLAPHPIHTDTSPLFVEGVAGSLQGTETALAEVEAAAAKEIREEISVEPSELIYIGYDYPSPGHNLERTYRYLAPIDPARIGHGVQTVDETVGVWYLELNDLLALVDEGVIRDPRLALNARLIAHRTGYPLRMLPKEDEAAGAHYDAIINHGSDIQAWLSDTAREIDNRLSRSVYYRRLKSYCENELGIVALTFTHPEEAGFFSAMVPVFAIPEHTEAKKVPFNFLHDLFHYATWGFVPLKRVREDGTPELHSFEDYFEAIGGNECHAVWYSDVIMPNEFGVKEAEAIFGGHSVAGAFAALGFTDEEARETIRSIELKGVVPKRLLEHPEFETFRGVFISRLLKYYVLDYANTAGVYEYWEKHPFVLMTAARFCNAFTDLKEYEQHYLSTLDAIRDYTEGLNPLRAHLARVSNLRIRLSAMRLAVLYEHLGSRAPSDSRLQEIVTLLDQLEAAYKELTALRETVADVDRSPKHLAMLTRLSELESGLFTKAGTLAQGIITDERVFSREESATLGERVLPFFEPFQVPDDKEIEQRVVELEAASRAA
ncbi:MAG TPA: hypothetical protein VEB18_02140 [Candidatus Paceibacterota bacterium]|nr:hypothetical protein [Candidatus Paceibacterota bacterium]